MNSRHLSRCEYHFGVPDQYANYGKVPVLLLGELAIDLGEVFAE